MESPLHLQEEYRSQRQGLCLTVPWKNKAVYRTIWTDRVLHWPRQPKTHEATGGKLGNSFREVCNRRACHEELCVEAKKAVSRILEVKRKATEIQEDVAAHRERTRRITNEHARAEGHVNDGIGSLDQALQAAARATHTVWRVVCRIVRATGPSTWWSRRSSVRNGSIDFKVDSQWAASPLTMAK